MRSSDKVYPNLCWEQFRLINDDRTGAFQDMCQELFRQEYAEEGAALHSDPNHPGIEVAPVPAKDKKGNGKPYLISFQAKCFDHTVGYSQIIKSMELTAELYKGKLDRVYLFCNLPVSTRRKEYATAESTLKKSNIELILITDKDIFSLLRKHKEIANYYFRDRFRGKTNIEYSDDRKSYLDAFKEPLFLETKINDGNSALLSDVYIPAEYKPTANTRESIYSLLESYFLDHKLPIERAIGIMILGQPGSGKSSFVSYLTTKMKNTPSKRYYIIRLRNLKSSQINSEDPIQGLLEYLHIEDEDLFNSILVLDGLDEICALYSNTDFSVYLKTLLQNLSKIDRLKLVITSRTGYFTIDDALKKSLYIIKIENWNDSNLDNWSGAYIQKHPKLQEVIKENTAHLKDEKYSDKKDIFAVPILFYMANARGELLSNHDSISSVYDAVLKEVTDERNYDPSHYNSTHKFINPKLARQICIEIAFSMFRCGRLNIIHDDPFLEPMEVETALSEAIAVCHEDEGAGLTEEDKRRIKETYALTFYYNKENHNHNAVEFAHRTIAEYFTSEKILQILSSSSNDLNEDNFSTMLTECFGYAPVTSDVLRFLYYKIRTNEIKTLLEPVKNALEKQLLNISLNGKLFGMPQKYTSNMHLLDRISVMLKSVLMLFEYLNCKPPKTNTQTADKFNNLIASIARCVPINAQHTSLLPIALNGFDLSEGKFISCDMAEAHLSGTNLTHTDFTDASLTDAQMSRSKIDLADFSGANLSGADLSNIDDAAGTEFTEASIQGADFSNSSFTNVSFDYAEMQEADLSNSTFGKGCHFYETVLYCACLDDADITEADISGAILSDEENDEEQEEMAINRLVLSQDQYDCLSEYSHISLQNVRIVGNDE